MQLRPSGSRTAATGLVAANLVPLVGVLAFGWNLHSLLVAYWLESGVVGAISVLKILRADGEDDVEDLPSMSFNDKSVGSFVGDSNRIIAGFFVSHYGVFWLVHGVFVFVMFAAFLDDFAEPTVVGLATILFVLYHGISYRLNYIEGREYERVGPVTQMVEPYRRVFVLHTTIVLGAFAVAMVGSPVGALVVMILVKTVLDFWGHWKEHDRARKRPSPGV